MPASVLTAVLVAHEASNLAAAIGPSRASDEAGQRFVVLGRFDQLILRVSETLPEALPHTGLAINARTASSCAYLGHMLGDTHFDPRVWAQTHPLIGFCSLRLARRALTATGSFDFIAQYLHSIIPEDQDIRWALASSTGWEDILVLFFGRSFNAIKHAIGRLRGLHADNANFPKPVDRQDGFHHLVLTSCTLPGVALQSWDMNWSPRDTETLLKNINAEERLRWAIRAETHPGHWDAFVQLLKQRSHEAGIEVKISPLFGQADLSLTPLDEKDATHRGLITFLTEVMFKLESAPATVIRTVETRLIPEAEGYTEDAGAGPTSTRIVRRDTANMLEEYRTRSKAALSAMGAPPHTLDALEETLARIQGMAGDRLHGEEFSAIRALADSFVRATAAFTPPQNHRDCEQISREILVDISDWQMHIERCLADRFRGPYPAGNSLMVRLGSHPGAHQRFLVTMDHLAQRAYNLARTCINQRLNTQALPDAALATFIGNSPSAYATGHMIRWLRCGFTDVPANMVGRLRDAHVVAHETGHHLFRAYHCSCQGFSFEKEIETALTAATKSAIAPETVTRNSALDPAHKELLRDLREIFADLFAHYLCFPNEPASHERAAYETIRNYYKGADRDNVFLRSVLIEVSLRQFAVQALLKPSQEVLETFLTRVRDHMQRLGPAGIEETVSGNSQMRSMKDRVSAIRLALAVIIELQKVPQFSAFITGLKDCGQTTHFPGESEDKSFLVTFRDLMRSNPAPANAENLVYLDRLWFIVLQSQSGLLS